MLKLKLQSFGHLMRRADSFEKSLMLGRIEGRRRRGRQRMRWLDGEFHLQVELSCFFHDPVDVGNLTSGSSAFSKTSLNIWKFTVHVLLKPGLENSEHHFTSV